MRNISFSMTTPQFIDGSKDVTRRFGWEFLQPGDRLMAVEKAMGLKKGEQMKRLGEIEVVSVRREPMSAMLDDMTYGMDELRREGFPFGCRSPACFVSGLLQKTKKTPDDMVTRIEFRRVDKHGD